MEKVKLFFRRFRSLWYVKYVVVIVLGVSFVGFIDDNSLWAHLRNKQRIDELSVEIERYQQQYRRDQNQIRELQYNPKAVEKIARERFFMKADDEDIFVMNDDAAAADNMKADNETAE